MSPMSMASRALEVGMCDTSVSPMSMASLALEVGGGGTCDTRYELVCPLCPWHPEPWRWVCVIQDMS